MFKLTTINMDFIIHNSIQISMNKLPTLENVNKINECKNSRGQVIDVFVF